MVEGLEASSSGLIELQININKRSDWNTGLILKLLHITLYRYIQMTYVHSIDLAVGSNVKNMELKSLLSGFVTWAQVCTR